DVSGSMSGQPIQDARLAAANFVNQLGPLDSICIYSFSTQVHKVQNCTTDKKSVIRALDTLEVGHNTTLYDVLDTVAQEHAKLYGRQVILLLSDGADNISQTPLADALSHVQSINIPVYTIGLTSKDFQGQILEQIAKTTGGSFLQAPTSGELDKLFGQVRGQI